MLREEEYLIGHIKGYITFDSDACGIGLSIVKNKVNLKPLDYKEDQEVKGFSLSLTSIVMDIEAEELHSLVRLGLGLSFPDAVFDAVDKPSEDEAEEEAESGEDKE